MKYFIYMTVIAFFSLLALDKSVLIVMGTRPEAIKLIPLYLEIKNQNIPAYICSTGQHSNLLDDVFSVFNIQPNFDFKIMKDNQDLFYITDQVLNKCKQLYQDLKPSVVVVQGDTTTAMAAGLAAFYLKIPVVHVEAGLRTGDNFAPFPEEVNRKIISTFATLNCAPTEYAQKALQKEGIRAQEIVITGNTVVDALRIMKECIDTGTVTVEPWLKEIVDEAKKKKKKIILLTAHRREAFGDGLKSIFSAFKQLLETRDDILILYPRHPNPTVKRNFTEIGLSVSENLFICEPLHYKELVYLLHHADLVATDSGGIQEEAVSISKPVIVLREKTERLEAVDAGLAVLGGIQTEPLLKSLNTMLDELNITKKNKNIYGDGFASQKIAKLLQQMLI